MAKRRKQLKTPLRKRRNNYISKQITKAETDILPLDQFFLDSSKWPSEDTIDEKISEAYKRLFNKYQSPETEKEFFRRMKNNISKAKDIDLSKVNRRRIEDEDYQTRRILKKADKAVSRRGERLAKGLYTPQQGETGSKLEPILGEPYFMIRDSGFVERALQATQGRVGEWPEASRLVVLDGIIDGDSISPQEFAFGPDEPEGFVIKINEIVSYIASNADKQRGKKKSEKKFDSNAKFDAYVEFDQNGFGIYIVKFYV